MAACSVCLLAMTIWAGIGPRSARSGRRDGAGELASNRRYRDEPCARSEAEAVALRAEDRRPQSKARRQTNMGLGPQAQAIAQRRRRFNPS